MSQSTSANVHFRSGEIVVGTQAAEPLSRLEDAAEFRAAYAKKVSGEWDNAKWQPFRLRFGVYGQLQPNVHMIRMKIPGGVMPFAWARTAAEACRRWGNGKVHVTTRQDLQTHFVKPDDVPEMLEYLYSHGMTTREACGNTLRNMTSCPLAGVCPKEHVDAGEVAARLAQVWIRHPAVQHMPRKFKVTVSGCEADCGASGIHDLGLVATHKDGKPGFKVYAGGGTGGQAISAVLVKEFADESEVPSILEALVRLHQKYSNRRNRNAARMKFVLKRFGAEKFKALFDEEYARVRGLPTRPWDKLAWRQGDESLPPPASPGGVVTRDDGQVGVVVKAPLGIYTADEMEHLVSLAEGAGASGLRTTRDQNLIIVSPRPDKVAALVDRVRVMGFYVENRVGDAPDVVACPGTTTCGIGITNSQNFGKEVQDAVREFTAKPNVSVKISGCQNGCGLHHVADFGFRGMGKKIGSRNAPHYQIYIGGDFRQVGHIGLSGPIVPARLGEKALRLMMKGYEAGRASASESVRDWALRLGKDGLKALVAPIEAEINPADEGLFYDFGEDWEFSPPAGRTSECAAGFADDDLQKDLADDALVDMDRAIEAGLADVALARATGGLRYSAQRLRIKAAAAGAESDDESVVLGSIRAFFADEADLLANLDRLLKARETARAGRDGLAAVEAAREALALWIDTVTEVMEKPAVQPAFDPAMLGDSGGSVAAMLRGSGA
ncbi:MAG TPA: nitrite/sulfite reductase [Alphaproteobacteria bacterium]|jgi:sulfite reductase (NADPH) hemoprotein beta-component|nr:nitrite/sulfite reductase [Alphaproteobacteria bacterium]